MALYDYVDVNGDAGDADGDGEGVHIQKALVCPSSLGGSWPSEPARAHSQGENSMCVCVCVCVCACACVCVRARVCVSE